MYFLQILPFLLINLKPNMTESVSAVVFYLIFCTLFTIFKKANGMPKFRFKQPFNPAISVISLMINLFPGVLFYRNFAASEEVLDFISGMGIAPNKLLPIITAVLFVLSSLGIYFFINYHYIEFYARDKEGFTEKALRPFSTKTNSALLAGISTLTLFVFHGSQSLWANTDNYWISCVLNGLYSEENHCLFVNPILSGIVHVIDKIFPYADGLSLLGQTLVLLGIWCVLYVLFKNCSKKTVSVAVLTVIALNYFLNLFNLPFTSHTAVLAFLGFFLIYSRIRQKSGNIIAAVGLVLIFFAAIWRFNALLLIVPFSLLVLVFDFFKVGKTQRISFLKRTAALMLPIVFICVSCVLIKASIHNSDYYSAGVKYNSVRSNLVDFPHKNWDEIEGELLGIGVSKSDYDCIKELIMADTDIFNTEYMQKVSDVSKVSFTDKLHQLIDTGLAECRIAIRNNYALVFELLLFALVTILVLLIDSSKQLRLKLLFAFGGAILICVYFLFVGHMPDYVPQAVFFGVWLVFACVFLNNRYTFRGFSIIKFVSLISALLIALNFTSFNTTAIYNTLNAKKSENSLIRLCDESADTVYIWNVFNFDSVIKKSDFFNDGRLLPEDILNHNIVDGEWTYNQPYYNEYLTRLGIDNPMKALIYREHTYYVGVEYRCDKIWSFLKEHYDATVTRKIVDYSNGYPVWQFSIPVPEQAPAEPIPEGGLQPDPEYIPEYTEDGEIVAYDYVPYTDEDVSPDQYFPYGEEVYGYSEIG